MSGDDNKALLKQYLKEVWEKQNPEAVRQFLAPHYQRYTSPVQEPLTLEDQIQRIRGFSSAFPDIQITVEQVFADGDYIAFHSTMRGTHEGPFLGIAPTGKAVTVTLIDIMRIENEKIIEHWGGPDLFDLLRQLNSA
jgi:predicted ester cyclase